MKPRTSDRNWPRAPVPQRLLRRRALIIVAKDKELKEKESILLSAHIVRMTCCVTDKDKREYLPRGRGVGKVFRELAGNNNAAMSAVRVSALVEGRAKVGIGVTVVVLQ